MATHYSDYLIVGGGLAGAKAVEGIRELDEKGSVTLIGAEDHLPYDRPPLSKKLWLGKKKVEDIFLHDQAFYDHNRVTFLPGRRVTELNADSKTVRDNRGDSHAFGKLLLTTGGVPLALGVPGGDLDGICYYRTLDDYQRIRSEAAEGKSAVVIGGGFIGSEMAAALCVNKLNVTMIYPSSHVCNRVFPKGLGFAMEHLFQSRGIRIIKGPTILSIERGGPRFVVRTTTGDEVAADMVIVGVGIRPAAELAEQAGLNVSDGIVVNEYLQTSCPDIYSAGDNTRFPFRGQERSVRLEHWDNALNQGKWAGRNMAGEHKPYTYLPYFFSDLFEFGYEAVGEVNSGMEIVADWQKENEKGILYYLKDGTVRGAMMCNVWDKVPAARELILKDRQVTPHELRGAIAI